jgi:predicted ATP-grasp superfamily ATP-dependent carboligase
MTIQDRKIALIAKFLKINDEQLIKQIEELTSVEDDSLIPFSVEELNERIERSEEDFKNGRFKTSKELLKKYG